MSSLNHATFVFVDCHGKEDVEYPFKGTYECVTVGGKEGLIHALMDMKPSYIMRKT